MAAVVSANYSLATNTVPLWMWGMIAFLKTNQSWTQAGSGDGATYNNAAAGPVASGSTGATGMGDSGSWVRLQKTISSVVYELLFYSGGSASGSILVSCDAAFTGGSPSATQRPTSASEEFLLGAGTAGAPSHGNPCTGNPAVLQMVCDNASPYGFWCWAYDTGTRINSGAFFMDALTNTYNSPAAPYVFWAGGDYTTSTDFTGTSYGKTRRRHNQSGAGWEAAEALADSLLPHGAGNDPNDTNKVRLQAITWGVSGKGIQGDSARMRWSSTNHGNSTLYSVTTTGDHIVAGAVVIKGWDNTVPT